MNTAARARWQMCLRKRRYYGKREAFQAANSAAERSGKPHRVYKCEFGDHLHITHQRKERS